MEQLLCHLIGDYIFQTDRMAKLKTTSAAWALLHAFTYTIPFVLLTRSPFALATIGLTHFVIDHWRLARYVTRFKNLITASAKQRAEGMFDTPSGYLIGDPPYLTTWLLIITDNTMHLCINFAALRWL
jgi:hypothetical protein